MNSMKKKLAAVFVILVVVAAVPLITGSIAKQALVDQLSRINQLPGYVAVLDEYRQGWLEASAAIRVGIEKNVLPEAAQKLPSFYRKQLNKLTGEFRLQVNIAHGPVFFAEGFEPGLMRTRGTVNREGMPNSKKGREDQRIKSLLFYETVTSLSGNTVFKAGSPAIEFSDEAPAQTRIRFGGMSLEGTYTASKNAIAARFEMPEWSMKGPVASVVCERMVAQGDVVVVSPVVQLGDIEMQWGGIRVYQHREPDATPDSQIGDVKLLLRSRKDSDDTVKMHIDGSVGAVVATDKKIDNLHLKADFERIGINALGDYYKQYRNAMHRVDSAKHRIDSTDNTGSGAQPLLVKPGNAFLRYSPALTISDFRFRYNGNALNVTGRANFDGEGLDESGDMSDSTTFLQRLAVNAKADISEGLAREISKQYLSRQWMKTRMAKSVSRRAIQKMAARQVGTFLEIQTQKGRLVRTDSGYQAVLSTNKGELLLNGKPAPEW